MSRPRSTLAAVFFGARGTAQGPALERVDAEAFRGWCRLACDGLRRARAGIDALNVFPVADSDTGTNMLCTLEAVVAELDRERPTELGPAVRTAARASLWAARGSSGAILSQYLHGLADVLSDAVAVPAEGADGVVLQRAFARAADAAYAAVAEPMEGTILSVARAAAKAAGGAAGADLGAVVRAAADGGRTELARTPSQLAVLAASGVVDAGGQGLVVVLDALRAVVAGSADVADLPEVLAPRRSTTPIVESSTHAYEVQYLLDAPGDALVGLREELTGLGDTVTVVAGDGTHNVHAHVDDVGAAIEAGIARGRPHRIRVTRFADQCADAVDEAAAEPRVVALCPPGALADLFRQAGAAVIELVPDAVPGLGDVLSSVREHSSSQTVVLPNSRELRQLADDVAAAMGEQGRAVTVIPTRSPLQGLAAVAVHDRHRRFDDDVVAMSNAAGATRYAEVTRATTDAQTSAGPCRAGDVLGLIDDDVAVIGAQVREVACSLVDRLLIGGGELVTIVTATDVAGSIGEGLADYVTATRPAVEVVHYADGVPGSGVLIGVE